MFHVVTGGSGSGKSVFAEELVVQFNSEPRVYVATMFPFDEESHVRIKRHQKQRETKRFETIECYTGLKDVQFPTGGTVLLECMSNLVANEMYQDNGAKEETVNEVMEGILHVLSQVSNLVVVTNEVFSDGIDYDEETKRYMRYLGEINQRMGRMADQVTEVVYGIPLSIKEKSDDSSIEK